VFLLYIHTDRKPPHQFISAHYPSHPKHLLLSTSSDIAAKEKAAVISDYDRYKRESRPAIRYTAEDLG